MRIDLTGRRALVTGSTSGMGFAIARGLAEAGAAVVVNGRHDGRVREAVDRLRSAVPGANVVVFLASEQASAITGSTVRVDGGIIRSLL